MAVTPPTISTADRDPKRANNAFQDDVGREGLRVRIEPVPGITDGKLLHGDGFYFQCPPLEEFTIEYAADHLDYTTAASGQYSRPGGQQLRVVTFDTLFVDYAWWTVVTRPIEIEDLTHRLVKICESGTPFLLTAAHAMPPHGYDTWSETLTGPELQMMATLRTLKVSEKAGEGDARYLNVAFTQYREPFAEEDQKGKPRHKHYRHHWPKTVLLYHDGTARDKVTSEMVGQPPRNPVTLHRLAKKYYHHPNLWKHISDYPKNRIKNWGADDQLIDYFLPKRPKRKEWPIKITIPKPPHKGGSGNSGGKGGGAGGGGSGASGGTKAALEDPNDF